MNKIVLLFLVLFSFSLCAQHLDPYKIDYSNTEPLEDYDNDKQKSDDIISDDTSSKNDDEIINIDEYDNYTPRGFVNTGYSFFPIYERIDSNTTAVGLDFSYYFRRYGEPPQSAPNYIRTLFMAGQNQYVNMALAFDNYWDNGLHNIYASLNYLRRAAAFYDISSEDPQLQGTYRASNLKFDLVYRQRIFLDAYLGAKYEYKSDDMSSRIPSAAFNENVFVGLTGSGVSGIGVVFGNLPNEDVFSPKSSFAYEISNMLYLKAFGSKSNFGKHTFDVRQYIGLLKGHTIAMQLYMNFLSGDPTYSQLSSIGDIFSAYHHDKYLDYHMMALRGEYRWMIFDRFAFTAFLGAGYHSRSLKGFRLNDYLPSYGAGFRYLLSEDLNSFARLEYFEGRGSRGFMFGIGDAF